MISFSAGTVGALFSTSRNMTEPQSIHQNIHQNIIVKLHGKKQTNTLLINTHYSLPHLIHLHSLSLHHKSDSAGHMLSRLDKVWTQSDILCLLFEQHVVLQSDSQPHLSHRCNESGRHKLKSLRHSFAGLCNGNPLCERILKKRFKYVQVTQDAYNPLQYLVHIFIDAQ